MRRRAAALALCLVALALPAPTGATGFASDNVTHIATVPFDAGMPTGARLVGERFYVAGARALSIYDVSDPTSPELLSTTPIGFQFANEDVDTNGEILLMSDDSGRKALHVWDVSDPRAPVEIATLPGMLDHTFSCVLDCRWAYGARGTIVDLHDATRPEVAGAWAPALPPGDGFDVTEVAPGLVLTSSRVIRLFDARKDPERPKLLAYGTTSDNRLIHSNRWPRSGRDDFFLVQGETPFSGRCDEDSGAFMTWDARTWRKTRTFRMIDEFRVTNGTLVDGDPPAGAFGCTVMWFQEHPDFRNGGLVAAAFFEHGTRFLDVDRRGRISQVGYFTPAGGSTIAAYWITDEIVYAIDVTRGIDILRFAGS